jgi:hypothetical protein
MKRRRWRPGPNGGDPYLKVREFHPRRLMRERAWFWLTMEVVLAAFFLFYGLWPLFA